MNIKLKIIILILQFLGVEILSAQKLQKWFNGRSFAISKDTGLQIIPTSYQYFPATEFDYFGNGAVYDTIMAGKIKYFLNGRYYLTKGTDTLIYAPPMNSNYISASQINYLFKDSFSDTIYCIGNYLDEKNKSNIFILKIAANSKNMEIHEDFQLDLDPSGSVFRTPSNSYLFVSHIQNSNLFVCIDLKSMKTQFSNIPNFNQYAYSFASSTFHPSGKIFCFVSQNSSGTEHIKERNVFFFNLNLNTLEIGLRQIIELPDFNPAVPIWSNSGNLIYFIGDSIDQFGNSIKNKTTHILRQYKYNGNMSSKPTYHSFSNKANFQIPGTWSIPLLSKDNKIYFSASGYGYIEITNPDSMGSKCNIQYKSSNISDKNYVGWPSQYFVKGILSDTFTFFKNSLPSIDSIYIPTIFTPNDDELNDLFEYYLPVRLYSDIATINMTIFNRWGAKIWFYQGTNIHKFWDGKSNDKLCMNGTYIYILNIKLKNNKNISRKGIINLSR